MGGPGSGSYSSNRKRVTYKKVKGILKMVMNNYRKNKRLGIIDFD